MPSRSRVAKNKIPQHHVTSITIPPLPSEILTRIFSESIRSWRETNYGPIQPGVSPVTLAAVCKQWRTVAFSSRQMWTHVYLVLDVVDKNGRYYSPEIWAEHSQGAPLDIHVSQYHGHSRAFEQDEMDEMDAQWRSPRKPAAMTHRLIDFLSALMSQVSSLNLFLCWPYNSILTHILDCWATHSARNNAKSLIVHNVSSSMSRELEISRSGDYQKALGSLETLCLHNATIPWGHFSLTKLTKLEVGTEPWGDVSVTISQSMLASVLVGCPDLRHLALDHVGIEPQLGQNLKPVLLNQLQTLRIGGCGNSRPRHSASIIESILSIIDPGPSSLALDISLRFLEAPQKAINSLVTFLRRSNVTALRAHGYQESGRNPRPCFASQLGPLPNVRTLTLQHWYVCDDVHLTDGIFFGDEPCHFHNPSEHVIWPSLQNLRLERCVLEKEHMRQLLLLHSIQSLEMRNCYDGYSSYRKRGMFEAGSQASKEYVRVLSQVVPRVVHCSDN